MALVVVAGCGGTSEPTAAVATAVEAPPASRPAPPPPAPCVDTTYVTLVDNNGAVAFCGDDTCVQLEGEAWTRAARVTPPERFPHAEVVDEADAVVDVSQEAGGSRARVCKAEGACVTLAPKKGKGQVRGAAVSADGIWAAVLLQPDVGAEGRVELYDTRTGKVVFQRKDDWDDHHGVSYTVAFAGPILVWIQYPGGTDAAYASLFGAGKQKWKELKGPTGNLVGHAVIGTNAVFISDPLEAVVLDTATGKQTSAIDLRALVTPAQEADWIEITDTGGGADVASIGTDRIAVAAVTPQAARVVVLGADNLAAPQYLDAPVCTPAAK